MTAAANVRFVQGSMTDRAVADGGCIQAGSTARGTSAGTTTAASSESSPRESQNLPDLERCARDRLPVSS
jgi:hypothetical protein